MHCLCHNDVTYCLDKLSIIIAVLTQAAVEHGILHVSTRPSSVLALHKI